MVERSVTVEESEDKELKRPCPGSHLMRWSWGMHWSLLLPTPLSWAGQAGFNLMVLHDPVMPNPFSISGGQDLVDTFMSQRLPEGVLLALLSLPTHLCASSAQAGAGAQTG